MTVLSPSEAAYTPAARPAGPPSVAGTVVDQSTFQLDGGNNTNDMDGSMSMYTPSYAGDPTGGVANQSQRRGCGRNRRYADSSSIAWKNSR